MNREQARWMLDHLVDAAVRYGHDLAILLVAADARIEGPMAAALRDADVVAPWAEGTYMVILPDKGRASAAAAAGRIRAAAGDMPVRIASAPWSGDTTGDLIERAERALSRTA